MAQDFFRPKIVIGSDRHEAYKQFEARAERENVLCIGDIHEPFCLDGYFEFCKAMYKKWQCNKVVFMGDIIDNHYSSFHDTNPDGMGGKLELEEAVKKLKKWHDAFPDAIVLYGNHDRIISRKAIRSNVSRQWLKDIKDVLETPTWTFKAIHESNDVQYVHGDGGGQARARARNGNQSTVCGHFHSVAYVDWFNSRGNAKVFGMQTGCGVDRESYAMDYAKGHNKPVLSVGLVLDNGQVPFIEMMYGCDGELNV